MAKIAKTVGKSRKTLTEKDKKIQAAMAKAIREVKRIADASKVKLAVAGKNSWAVPK